MQSTLEFTTTLKGLVNNEAMYIEFPYDVQEMYGTRGWVKVKATFDGVPYRGSLSNLGGGCHILIVRKDIRRQIGKNPGDEVLVTVERDTEERLVEVPDDLLAALNANAQAAEFYESLSYTNRKEYAEWVRSAKRPETRVNRITASIEKMLAGKKNPG